MQDAYEFLNEKLRSENGEKNIFCKLDIRDENVFYTDIYMITTLKFKIIYMLIYKKKFNKMSTPF